MAEWGSAGAAAGRAAGHRPTHRLLLTALIAVGVLLVSGLPAAGARPVIADAGDRDQRTETGVHFSTVRLTLKTTQNKALGRATVRDESGVVVQGATVTGEWTIDGVGGGDLTASSNAQGKATFTYLDPAPGAVTGFCVSGIVLDGFVYDPAADTVPLCGEGTWPGGGGGGGTETGVHFSTVRLTLKTTQNKALGRATVRDESGVVVQGATVTGEWTIDGVGGGDLTASSNAQGKATFTYLDPAPGAVTGFCVSGIVLDGFVYDPAADTVPLCGEGTWPGGGGGGGTETGVHFSTVRLTLKTTQNKALGRATVRDESGVVVQGATVTGEWTIDGVGGGDLTASSNAQGKATFTYLDPAPGAVTGFCVSGIVLDGFVYDPAADTVPLCGEGTWPGGGGGGGTDPGWAGYVNGYRTESGLAPVSENASWSHGNEMHSRYSVKNNILQHWEDQSNPWFSSEGDAAARASNLSASSAAEDHIWAIDSWLQAPFHAVGMLDPQLREAGYGQYFDPNDTSYRFAAGLDVIRGTGSLPAGTNFPIVWPGNNSTVPLTHHWGERPSPLTSCPGYQAPTGLPLIVQIGAGSLTPNVQSSSVTGPNGPMAHCVFDETDYVNSNASEQDLGRGILDGRDAIVIIPREPLAPGASYDISITVNGATIQWSFSVLATPHAVDAAATPPGF